MLCACSLQFTICLCWEMADHNPLDAFLQHSDTDESVVNALVASLESRLASPTNKDQPLTLSSPSVNSNHVNSTSNNSACTAASTPISAQNKTVYISSDTPNANSSNAKQVLKGNQILGINSIHSSSVVKNVNSPVNSLRTSSPKPVQNVNKPSSPVVHVIPQTSSHGSSSIITTIVQHSNSGTVVNSINNLNNPHQVNKSNIKSVQISNHSSANQPALVVQTDSRTVASTAQLVSSHQGGLIQVSQPVLKSNTSVVVNSSSQPVTQITNVHLVHSANVTSIIPSHGTNPSIIAVRGQMPSSTTPMTTGRQHVVSHIVNASSPRPQGNVRGQPIRMPNTPIRIAASTQPNQINIAPRPGGPTGTVTLPPGIVSSQVLMKNGQLVIVQQQGSLTQPVTSSHPNSPASQRLPSGQILIQPGGPNQSQTVVRQPVPQTVNTARSKSGVRVSLHQNVQTVVGGSAQGVVSTVAHTQGSGTQSGPVGHAANQQQQMLDNVKKCKNFLSTLIKLAASQPEATVSSVRDLIQGLIDGKLQPELFTERLQKELKSSPQPYLVPFLKKSLPLLRQSLLSNKMSIDGVRPPPLEVVQQQMISSSQPTSIHHTQNVPKTAGTSNLSTKPTSTHQIVSHSNKPSLTKQMNMGAGNVPSTVKAFQSRVAGLASSPSPGPSHTGHKEKKKFESLKDDDDINDVATMGGVNLSEESRNILATNAEYIGTQIRSCKDEAFLFHGPLLSRITAIANKHGISEVPTDVVNLVSHATQERLRHIVEKLSTIAEQRTEIYKINDKFEPSVDVKSQLKFLEELDVMERKRHDEQEKEMLRRAAKSRTKHEDPEHLKLKQRAKDLQQAEMEEARQREANLTALAAIGPRKKRKLDTTESVSNTPGSNISNGIGSSTRASLRPRIKRVNLRDLLFLMEQDRTLSKSNLLYRTLLR